MPQRIEAQGQVGRQFVQPAQEIIQAVDALVQAGVARPASRLAARPGEWIVLAQLMDYLANANIDYLNHAICDILDLPEMAHFAGMLRDKRWKY